VARYSFDGSSGRRYLTLRSGDNLYIGQPVDIRPHTPYLLTFTYRTHDSSAALNVPLCELWVLTSFRCSWNSYPLASTGGRWAEFSALIRTAETGSPAGRIGALAIRPVRLTLYATRAADGLSLDNIALVTTDGRNLIRNGDFSANHDHWFWTADNHRPWHIFNMAVSILFDQGWLGLAALTVLTALALIALCRGVWAGRSDAVPWLAALVGYLAAGLVVSPFDQPRLAMLFYLLCFIAVLRFARAGGAASVTAQAASPRCRRGSATARRH